MYFREEGTAVFKLNERYESIYCTATARAAMVSSIESQSEVDRQVTQSNGLWSISYNYGISP